MRQNLPEPAGLQLVLVLQDSQVFWNVNVIWIIESDTTTNLLKLYQICKKRNEAIDCWQHASQRFFPFAV